MWISWSTVRHSVLTVFCIFLLRDIEMNPCGNIDMKWLAKQIMYTDLQKSHIMVIFKDGHWL